MWHNTGCPLPGLSLIVLSYKPERISPRQMLEAMSGITNFCMASLQLPTSSHLKTSYIMQGCQNELNGNQVHAALAQVHQCKGFVSTLMNPATVAMASVYVLPRLATSVFMQCRIPQHEHA